MKRYVLQRFRGSGDDKRVLTRYEFDKQNEAARYKHEQEDKNTDQSIKFEIVEEERE